MVFSLQLLRVHLRSLWGQNSSSLHGIEGFQIYVLPLQSSNHSRILCLHLDHTGIPVASQSTMLPLTSGKLVCTCSSFYRQYFFFIPLGWAHLLPGGSPNSFPPCHPFSGFLRSFVCTIITRSLSSLYLESCQLVIYLSLDTNSFFFKHRRHSSTQPIFWNEWIHEWRVYVVAQPV